MTYYSDETVTLHHGDTRKVLADLPAGSVDCAVTSPPYFGLRDYGVDGQIGAEASPAEFVAAMVDVFEQVRRVLADDGTCWLNLGDSYSQPTSFAEGAATAASSTLAGSRQQSMNARPSARRDQAPVAVRRHKMTLPAKNMLGVPWRVAFALQDAGWILRNAIVWAKPNAMPESVTDRLSTRYELIFMLTKSRKYHFNLDAIREPHTTDLPAGYSKTSGEWVKTTAHNHNRTGVQGLHINGRNPGDVWTIATQPFPGAHFAAFPPEIPRRAILAGCKPGGTVLDPFHGSGTTGMVAQQLGRKYVGIDLNSEYLDLSLRTRLADATLNFEGAS